MGAGFPLLAEASYWWIPGFYLFLLIHVTGIALFGYIAYRRVAPLLLAQTDIRFDRPLERLARLFKYWFAQWRHPRYPGAGVLHILLFAGFLILVIRAFAVLGLGFSTAPIDAESSVTGRLYGYSTNYAATVVFGCVLVAIFRRLVLRPVRYEVPPDRGPSHRADAIFLLTLIGILMLADSFFEGSQPSESLAFLSLPWLLQRSLSDSSHLTLSWVYQYSYLLHVVTFYFLLCYRPFGIQFHVETSLFSIYFAKLDRATEAGPLGRSRRASGPGEIPGGQTVRGFHLEAHARLLFMRRLRPVLRPVPGACRGPAAFAALFHHQGSRLRVPSLPGLRRLRQRRAAGGRHLLRGRNLVLHHLRRLRSGNVRC